MISLVGSLTTDKRFPKDVDLLVEVQDRFALDSIAKAGGSSEDRHCKLATRVALMCFYDIREGNTSEGSAPGNNASRVSGKRAKLGTAGAESIFTMTARM